MLTRNEYFKQKEELESISQKYLSEIKSGQYRSRRNGVSNYNGINNVFMDDIASHISKIKNKNKPLVHLDLCGRLNAFSLGADVSYMFTLGASHKNVNLGSNEFLVDGDIFNNNDYQNLLNIISKNNHKVSFITFEIIAAFRKYEGNGILNESSPLVNHILKKRLDSSLKLLEKDGIMYLSSPFHIGRKEDFIVNINGNYEKEIGELSVTKGIVNIAKKNNCEVKYADAYRGPFYLIIKN